MADYSKEIKDLEAIVNGAIDSTSTDGVNVALNITSAKTRLRELYLLDDNSASALVRPVITTTRLGGAW